MVVVGNPHYMLHQMKEKMTDKVDAYDRVYEVFEKRCERYELKIGQHSYLS